MRRRFQPCVVPAWLLAVAAAAHADTILAGGRVLDRAALDAMEAALLAAGSEAD